jgi:hypothetical protein
MQIWKMPAEGGAPVQITTSGIGHIPIESPDGNTVFYHAPQDPGEIRSVPVQGGESVRITGPTHPFPAGFTVTSEGIYYGAPPHSGEQRYIRFFSFRTGQSRPVILANRQFHIGLSVSPDSKYILFDQYDESGSDLMLVENFSLR